MAALQPIAPAAIADRSAAAPSALVIPTCLRCSKRIAVSSNDEFCHFDKGPAAKCSYCRKQKKVCLPIPPRFVPDVNLLYQTHAFWCLTPDNSQEDEDASEVSAEELTLLLVSKLSRIGDLMERIVDSYRFVNNLPALDVAAAAPTAPLIAALKLGRRREFMAPVIHPRAVRAVADALQGVQAPPGPQVQGLRKGSAKLKRSVIVDPNESEESAPEEDDVSDQPHQTTGAPRHPLDESVPALLFGSLGRKNAPLLRLVVLGSLKSRKRAPSTVQQVYIAGLQEATGCRWFPTGARPVSEIRENEEEGVGDQDEISGGVRLIRSGSRVPGDMPAMQMN
ncbi:hypothetical protein H4I96_12451 [Botrytis cinerea]